VLPLDAWDELTDFLAGSLVDRASFAGTAPVIAVATSPGAMPLTRMR